MKRSAAETTASALALATVLALVLAAAPAGAATIFKIDIDSTTDTQGDVGDRPIETEPGYTSFDVTNNTSIIIDGVTFTQVGKDGDRNRTEATTDLLTDFTYDSGSANLGLQIAGLDEGVWEAKLWSFDSRHTTQAQQQEVGVTDGITTQLDDGLFDPNEDNPAIFQFDTTDFDGDVTVFVKGTGDGARFNGLELMLIPEPTSLVLLGVGGMLLLGRRGWRR